MTGPPGGEGDSGPVGPALGVCISLDEEVRIEVEKVMDREPESDRPTVRKQVYPIVKADRLKRQEAAAMGGDAQSKRGNVAPMKVEDLFKSGLLKKGTSR
jgi:hypothetical protein